METNFNYVDENYKKICENVENAKAMYRNSSDEIKIMAVTKTVAPEIVNHAVSLGLNLLGENKVQEYLSKKDSYNKNADIHFIGHLQTNKVKYIIDTMKLIHSVDSFKLAEEINRLAVRINKIQDILIEINIGDENSKSGIDKAELTELICQISELPNVKVQGLMCIPPFGGDEHWLADMHDIYQHISDEKINNVNMNILSMGMSGDYEKAIKHGANIVRIGTALFGTRNYLK